MNVSFFCRFLAIGVFLCGESCQSFLEQIYFQWIKASNKCIDPEIILEAIDQMWIRDVLRDNVARLPLDFCFAPNNFDASTARGRTRLHDVHVLVILCFSVHRELTEIIWE